MELKLKFTETRKIIDYYKIRRTGSYSITEKSFRALQKKLRDDFNCVFENSNYVDSILDGIWYIVTFNSQEDAMEFRLKWM